MNQSPTDSATPWPRAVDWVAPAIKPPLDWQPIRRWSDQSRPRLKESIADHIQGPRQQVVDRTRQMVPTVLQEESVDQRLARLAFMPTVTVSMPRVRGVSPEPEAPATTGTGTDTGRMSYDEMQQRLRETQPVFTYPFLGPPVETVSYLREDGVWVPVAVSIDTIYLVT